MGKKKRSKPVYEFSPEMLKEDPSFNARQVVNTRAGFEVLITVRSATTLYTDGVGYAGAVQLPTFVAAPAVSAIVISGIWYINLTVICSSGTFTAQVGSIEEIR